jgi:hypothetical protein
MVINTILVAAVPEKLVEFMAEFKRACKNALAGNSTLMTFAIAVS